MGIVGLAVVSRRLERAAAEVEAERGSPLLRSTRDRRVPPMPAPRRVARAGRPRQGGPVPRRDVLGPARARASVTRRRGSCCWASRRPPTAATGPAGSSPATRSGDFLFAALHRAGLASSPVSRRADDGLTLHDAYIAAAVRCAPPANKPTPEERDRCAPFLHREIALLPRASSHRRARGVRLGRRRCGRWRPSVIRCRARRPVSATWRRSRSARTSLLGSYHPSQQNTFTGKLTPAMFDAVVRRAVARADG